MRTGLKVMDAMTKEPVKVSLETSAYDCAKLMEKEHVGSLIIEDKGKIQGIVSEQDFVYKLVAAGKDPTKVKVREIMTEDVVSISPDEDIADAILKMSTMNVRRLPVVDEGMLVGMLTLKDILKIEPQLFELIIDKIELREEKSKPIFRVGDREGVCELCGDYSEFLFENDGSLLCRNCRD